MIEIRIPGLPVNYTPAFNEANDDVVKGGMDEAANNAFSDLLIGAIRESSVLCNRTLKIVVVFGLAFRFGNEESLAPVLQDMLPIISQHFTRFPTRSNTVVAISGEIFPSSQSNETIIRVYEMQSDDSGGYVEKPDHTVNLTPAATREVWAESFLADDGDF